MDTALQREGILTAAMSGLRAGQRGGTQVAHLSTGKERATPCGSCLLCRTEQFLIFERRFSSDDPIQAQEFEPSEGWCEFVISLRPPDPKQLTCPRKARPDLRYLHHHLVVRVEPGYLLSLIHI